MKERFKMIRKAMNLTQTEFGNRIGMTRDAVSNIELGRVEPKDIHVISVCREFGISETWIRTGEGNMKAAKSENDQLKEWVGSVLDDDNVDTYTKKEVIELLTQLKPEHWKVLADIGGMFIDMQKRRGE